MKVRRPSTTSSKKFEPSPGSQLGAINVITAHRVEAAEREKYRFLILNEAADLLVEAEGNPPSKARRHWRAGKGEIEVSVFLRSLALECRDEAAGLVELLWQEVTSLEQVWLELSADFAGEDIVVPSAARAWTKLPERCGSLPKPWDSRSCPNNQMKPWSVGGRRQ